MPLRKTISILGALLATVATTAISGPADAATNDPLRSQQWGLDQVRAAAAWATSTGSGVVVAVVDSGVDLNHPDLQGQLVPGVTTVDCGRQRTYCGNGSWEGTDGVAQSADSHGTHVSGIVAAAADNGIGVAGVARDAKVMPIKSLEDGSGSFEEIAAGIRYAADHGADVINLSLGAVPGAQALTITGLESSVTDAIAYATSKGVLVVAAAGNESFPVCDTPSFEPGALCVTATTPDETPAWYTNGAVKPDLDAVAAPGGAGLVFCEDDVVSTVPVGTGSETCGQQDYDYYAGTSMATPHVAGVAALLYAQGRNRANVHDALVGTARTPGLGTGVFTTSYGHGIVDAQAAVDYPVTTTGAARKNGKKK
ncbi:peptidase S8 [Nocardioides immobilis]|uniref:Peptidase S8 n=1 Tax=Nocardioides immobilis TaxID=2049295 RepID=A0A417Y962_9ACTN|nr:S8 family serine peptidase [Nocardioides immobilis]RHW29101.1 peptidase S8 [Nocardioides immobilis]